MTAGLPGAGVGGLFFVLSAFYMLVVEIHRTIRRRSSLARWRLVGRQIGIASAMVAAVTVTIWGVHGLLLSNPARSARPGRGLAGAGLEQRVLPFSPVLIALAVLVAVLGAAFGARLVFARRGR